MELLSPEEEHAIWIRILKSHGSGKGKHPKALLDVNEKPKVGKKKT